jgi:uncharacterized protein (UPF0335 family)
MKAAVIDFATSGANLAPTVIDVVAAILVCEDQIAAINDQKKMIFKKARQLGFDQVVLRKGISEQRLDPAVLAKRNQELDAFHRILQEHRTALDTARQDMQRAGAQVHVHEGNGDGDDEGGGDDFN